MCMYICALLKDSSNYRKVPRKYLLRTLVQSHSENELHCGLNL